MQWEIKICFAADHIYIPWHLPTSPQPKPAEATAARPGICWSAGRSSLRRALLSQIGWPENFRADTNRSRNVEWWVSYCVVHVITRSIAVSFDRINRKLAVLSTTTILSRSQGNFWIILYRSIILPRKLTDPDEAFPPNRHIFEWKDEWNHQDERNPRGQPWQSVSKRIKSFSKTRDQSRLTCDAQPSFRHPTKTPGPMSWKGKNQIFC